MIPQLGPLGSAATLMTYRIEPDAALGGAGRPTPPEQHPDNAVTAIAQADEHVETVARHQLAPRDPDAPAGPPPAFEASILDRRREALVAPPDLLAPAPGKDEVDAPYDVPPSRIERATETITTVRRIETPYDTATVDVSR